ncbi:TPA: helix-turn-helix transcriptional regulator [Streptococcus agalactiae]|uniref:helix-turn-helix domain-containing protein n=1 Tax=Streptococcus agalactiae TaxID=1311 RepID=UPI0002BA4A54|nr:helix-turn-helix transcriptional regulator [Streptococcus agalactiae]EPU76695.1 XRE family transcriptional regulator [Streptococcus agalactiae GB00115]EPU94087.1 XRE family transcriptional regulator [Streptococcus agalactiae GB00264]EPU95322.1 XRE family transcriptional regulator [Streptococcus agalactiae GB00279]EPV11985.1 XRE family transcriptional regulator [Streptococcus agalactiae GB00561]KAF0058464.1 helix-turn-helix domain-containing protein [Streptococcus agalactiae]
MFTTFDRVKELSQKRGISLSKLEETLGLGKNSIYALKRNQPSAERLQEIADYFNVSTDYLLGRTDNPNIAKDNQEYTSDDLRKMAEKAKTFDGKPLTDSDIDAIQNIIEIYLKGR